MNKQELIEYTSKKVDSIGEIKPWYSGYKRGIYETLKLIERLDEPEITEEQAWEVIGEAYADSEKGRLMNAKKILDSGLKMQGIINTVEFELNKNNDKRTFEEFVLDSIKEAQLTVIPQFVADYIEKSKTETYSLLGSMSHFSRENDIDVWIRENQETFAKAWIDGYVIEPPKTLQVIVKNYDSTVYKTELPEDEAMKLIEGWKEDERETF